MSKDNQLDFTGQIIYTGIDVHKKDWKVSILLEEYMYKQFSQPPKPEVLGAYLRKHFPGGTYKSVYEAGYCGFWIHDELLREGIANMVVNPCDVPTSDKEKKQKTDKRDALKLAKMLRGGHLEGIYTPGVGDLEYRSLVRLRDRQVKDLVRTKNRIKHDLLFMGVEIPVEFDKQNWSRNFVAWVWTVPSTTAFGKLTLSGLLEQFGMQRKLLLKTNRQLRQLSKLPLFESRVELLISIPGIGLITALKLLTELGDIKRFGNFKRLASYFGLMPTTSSSGTKDRVGNITSRANKRLRTSIIEASWVAIRNDPALALKYGELKKKMTGQRAIVRIARKLLSRIRFVLINEVKYEIGKVK